MRTARLLKKAFNDFDKLSKDLDGIQVVALKEINRNDKKSIKIRERYDSVILFLHKLGNKLIFMSQSKRSEIAEDNSRISTDAKRALRVSYRINELLK